MANILFNTITLNPNFQWKLFYKNLLFPILYIPFVILTRGIMGLYSIFSLLSIIFILFYGFKLIFKDSITSIFYIICITIIISFIPINYQSIISYITFSLVISIIVLKFKYFKVFLYDDYIKLLNIPFFDILSWLIVFILILFIGFYDNGSFIANDLLHPTGSLSIGQSYSISIFNAPDLSYSGKELRYNFIFELVPIYLANLLNISNLSSIYFESIFFLTILSFITIHSIFNKYNSIKIPIIVILFMPIYNTQFHSEILFRRTILFTPSYYVSSLLIIISIYFLINMNNRHLVISSLVLIMAKSMYFLTFFGGVVLYLFKFRDYKRLLNFITFIVPIFLIYFYLFLTGAAGEALWLIFPQFIYERFSGILMGPNLDFNFLSFSDIWVTLILCYSALTIYQDKNSSDILVALSSLSLSGFLGICFLSEIVSLSARHFYNAAAFPMVVTFFYWFKYYYSSSDNKTVFVLIPFWLYFIWAVALFNHIIGFKFHPDILYLFLLLFVVSFSAIIINYKIPLFYFIYFTRISIYVIVLLTFVNEIKHNKLLMVYFKQYSVSNINHLSTFKFYPYNVFSNHLLHGYSWLKSYSPPESIVLIGKHYELIDRSYIRSAISGRNMYSENHGYRGVSLEPDYSFRFANSVNFYKNFVECSSISDSLLNVYYDNDYYFEGKPEFNYSLKEEKEHSFKGQLLYTLSLGKNWSGINISAKVDPEIKTYWDQFYKMNEKETMLWPKEFLKTEGINYIVLENGDHPSSLLLKLTDKVYENSKVIILRVKDNLL